MNIPWYHSTEIQLILPIITEQHSPHLHQQTKSAIRFACSLYEYWYQLLWVQWVRVQMGYTQLIPFTRRLALEVSRDFGTGTWRASITRSSINMLLTLWNTPILLVDGTNTFVHAVHVDCSDYCRPGGQLEFVLHIIRKSVTDVHNLCYWSCWAYICDRIQYNPDNIDTAWLYFVLLWILISSPFCRFFYMDY